MGHGGWGQEQYEHRDMRLVEKVGQGGSKWAWPGSIFELFGRFANSNGTKNIPAPIIGQFGTFWLFREK